MAVSRSGIGSTPVFRTSSKSFGPCVTALPCLTPAHASGRTPLLGPGVIRPPFVDRTRCKGSCQNHLYGCLWSYVSEHSGTNNNYWVLFSKSRSIHSSASVSRAHTAGGGSHSGFSRLVSICCGPQGYENGADDMDRKCSTQYFSLYCRNVGDSGAYATSIS